LTTNLAIRYNYIYEKQHLLLRKTGQKNNAEPKIKFSVYGGEKGIRTHSLCFIIAINTDFYFQCVGFRVGLMLD